MADALVRMAGSFVEQGASSGHSSDRYMVVLHADTATLATGEGEASIEGGVSVTAETAARIACDAPVVALLERNGQPLSVGRKTRKVHRGLRRALEARDRGCRFPGCHRRGRTEAHHVEHWARGGETRPENLVSLCRGHHTDTHELALTIERSGSAFVFRRPDGSVIEARSQLWARGADLGHKNRSVGIEVDADTCAPDWGGERGSVRYVADLFLSRLPP
jgi:hypothetical protein